LADTIGRVADHYGSDVNVIHGQGEFLESNAYQASSQDTRKTTSRMVDITKSLLGQSIILTGQKTPNR
jgi:hypothetical protein